MADFFNTINERTMVRSFKETPVSEADKKKIIDAGIRAPTAGGNEQWVFIIIDSEEKRVKLQNLLIQAQAAYYTKMMKTPWTKEKIEKWFDNNDKDLYRAPFYIAVFTDLRERAYTRENIELIWAHQSSAAAIENMLLAACALGMGGCWFGVPLLMEKEFLSLIGVVNEGMKLAAVLAIGYPKVKPIPRQRKKTFDDVVKYV
jgi:nitroreductase